ncbi:MAG: metalloregulator ArsR/SmtB family transcription factor [Deltaproteobacteria bacterium]|nr:metalloregulator ArsR/SmtB family transcription factor [Deltaproteobacteria bacterium]
MVASTVDAAARWELYRLLGEPVRLRLLALAAEEELAVGELAELLGESQPNVSRHLAPLRQAGLLAERKQGTRVLVHLAEGADRDAVIADALGAGRNLCRADGSLGRVAEIVRGRDAAARAYFAKHAKDEVIEVPPELSSYLAAFAPLLPERALAVDAGTGDGGLLDVIAPVFDRVVAFDREPAQLRRCAARLERHGHRNVELVQGDADSEAVQRAVKGKADVVFAARFLHHAPQPAGAVKALASLAKPGGALVIIDYARHDDESMREQADLWLGFDDKELARLARGADLQDAIVRPLPRPFAKTTDAHLPWQVLVARTPHTERRKR